MTKAKGLQGCGPRRSSGVTSHTLGSVRKCEGMNPHTPKATPTLGNGVLVDSQNFREQFEDSKLNFLWRSLYHWKALGTYMSKMGLHCSFGHLKHKLWPKARPGVKLPIWLTLLQTSLQSEVCSQSYGALKSRECPLVQFQDSHAGVPGEKSHLDVGLVERSRVYYKREGDGFPQVQAVVSLVCPCCPWFVLTPKLFQLCTNHFVWVVCKHVWVSEACQFFLVPS
jgi:hypothetical protein